VTMGALVPRRHGPASFVHATEPPPAEKSPPPPLPDRPPDESDRVRGEEAKGRRDVVQFAQEGFQIVANARQALLPDPGEIPPTPLFPEGVAEHHSLPLGGGGYAPVIRIRPGGVSQPSFQRDGIRPVNELGIEVEAKVAEHLRPRCVPSLEQVFVSHRYGSRSVSVSSPDEGSESIAEIELISVKVPPTTGPASQDGCNDVDGIAPQEDELPVGEQLEQFLRDEVVSRRLVEEIPCVLRRRLGVQIKGESSNGGPIVAWSVCQLRHEILDPDERCAVAILGCRAKGLRCVKKGEEKPRLGRRRDLIVARQDALHIRRTRPGKR
jgi:hypothetical protein